MSRHLFLAEYYRYQLIRVAPRCLSSTQVALYIECNLLPTRWNWSQTFKNSLIEVFYRESICLHEGTKIMLLWQLEVGILTKVRLGGGHFEIWLPTVVKYNFSLSTSKILSLRKLWIMWYHYRVSAAKFRNYYNILIIYSNMQIILLNMHDAKMSQTEMDSTQKNTPGSVEESLVVMIIKLLHHLHCIIMSLCQK